MTLFALGVADDLLAVRFAYSPIWETQAAGQAFGDERARSYHQPWNRLVRERSARLDLTPLLAVLPTRGYVPDFLTPTSANGPTTSSRSDRRDPGDPAGTGGTRAGALP